MQSVPIPSTLNPENSPFLGSEIQNVPIPWTLNPERAAETWETHYVPSKSTWQEWDPPHPPGGNGILPIHLGGLGSLKPIWQERDPPKSI